MSLQLMNGTSTSYVAVLMMPAGQVTPQRDRAHHDVELVNQQRKINLHLIINIGRGTPLLPADAGD
jgi:hypothetical protein